MMNVKQTIGESFQCDLKVCPIVTLKAQPGVHPACHLQIQRGMK